MCELTEEQKREFRHALRSKSCTKLSAKEFTRLKKPVYKDYLMHVKKLAQADPVKNKTVKLVQPSLNTNLNNKLERTNLSYYYCEKAQLLSLKEFVLLMQYSQKRNLREEKAMKKLHQKQLNKMVERSIQHQNPVKLRLTSAYSKKIIDKHRKLDILQ